MSQQDSGKKWKEKVRYMYLQEKLEEEKIGCRLGDKALK
jgi:hypothetical protein